MHMARRMPGAAIEWMPENSVSHCNVALVFQEWKHRLKSSGQTLPAFGSLVKNAQVIQT